MQPRAYQGADDLAKMQTFTAMLTQQQGVCGLIHIGDIAHRIYSGLKDREPSEVVWLWEDADGRLLAWTIIYGRFEGYDFQILPEHFGSDLHHAMLDWVEAQTIEEMRRYGKQMAFGMDIWECDTATIELLKSRGYTQKKHLYWYTIRDLNEPIPEPVLPDGYTIRNTTGIEEAEKLAAVHSGSFGSTWTGDTYRKLMLSPGYDPQREMVVVAPDGQFAAFCIYWVDALNQRGLFEPVGTHKDFHRKGLGRALLYATLRRMKDQSVQVAIVMPEVDNPASMGLYMAVGFQKLYAMYDYRKDSPAE